MGCFGSLVGAVVMMDVFVIFWFLFTVIYYQSVIASRENIGPANVSLPSMHQQSTW